jgi:hypothetical protein
MMIFKKNGMIINNVIILNDLRAFPIIATIKIKNNISNSIFIAHSSIFKNNEYADYTNNTWKFILKFILKTFFGLKIINTSSTGLAEKDKMGYYSSLYSITNDSIANEDKYPEISNKILKITLGTYDIISYLEKWRPKNVFIFNGRTASSYLITKFCVRNSINLFIYEFAGHLNGFRLFPVPPHAAGKIGQLYIEYFKNGVFNNSTIAKAAELLKQEKLNSIYKKLNNKKSTETYDISIFLGSDFEYTAVDPEICDITWHGNFNFCKSVIEKYGKEKKYAIRCHPNSNIDPNWERLYSELVDGINSLNLLYVNIIPPNSKIDSHDIIINSSIVVTDLSTISLDSILLEKVTDIFGNTDIKYIYNNAWLNKNTKIDISKKIMQPYALSHNLFVFRFTIIEKVIGYILFIIHRVFDKIHLYKNV